MKIAILVLISFLLSSSKNITPKEEQVIFDRIEFIFNLKSVIDAEIWNGFNNSEYDVPFIYFTENSSFVANPTTKFLKIFEAKLVFDTGKLKIYKTEKRIDSSPFHMETSVNFGKSDKASFNYKTPYLFCSSVEVTRETIPDTESTDYWITMVLHEYFHGFQFKHKNYLNKIKKSITKISQDSLAHISENNNWFETHVKSENQFLLNALETSDLEEMHKNIQAFFTSRNQRRTETIEKLKVDITASEQIYETMEGTARYLEFSIFQMFSKFPSDQKLLTNDMYFQHFKQFKNYKLENDSWLYTAGNRYFYATGFNIIRLLDKLGIEYKSRLFKEEALSLETLLLEALK